KIGMWAVVLITIAMIPVSFLGHTWMVGQGILQLLYLFLFGYLLAANSTILERLAANGAVALLVSLILFYGLPIFGYVLKGWWMVLTAISCTVLVGLASVKHYRILEWRPIRMMGVLSFGFYALHWLGLWAANGMAETLSARGVPNNAIIPLDFIC